MAPDPLLHWQVELEGLRRAVDDVDLALVKAARRLEEMRQLEAALPDLSDDEAVRLIRELEAKWKAEDGG